MHTTISITNYMNTTISMCKSRLRRVTHSDRERERPVVFIAAVNLALGTSPFEGAYLA